jgi:hypothetical protein
MILGGVLKGIWRAVDLGKSCQSVQLYAFSGFGPCWCGVRFGICFWKGSGMHFVRFWCRLGTHGDSMRPLLPAFSGPDFGGGSERAKRSEKFEKPRGWGGAGGRGGAAKLALADQELDSTRLAPSRRDGAADLTGYAHCRRPLSRC